MVKVLKARPVSPLRARRNALNLKIEDVARAAKVSVSYISLVERGKRTLPLPGALRARLAQLLDTPEAELFPGAE